MPFECRLSQTPEISLWKCQICIRWEFDSSGARLDEVQEIPFGVEMTDPRDVELALRRAQAAVLNPKMPSERILRMGLDELRKIAKSNQLSFSRNAVCVDISGPQLADIAFVDLPGMPLKSPPFCHLLTNSSLCTGIIQNADQEVVDLVEDVVKFHIRGNCLILVALPMSGAYILGK